MHDRANTTEDAAGGNLDPAVVADFGREWARYDQSALGADELETLFAQYFSLFPFDALPRGATGFDLGCGSGRWARLCAPRVGHLHCVDPAAGALTVARRNLAALPNVSFHLAAADALPFADGSMDFGYSLGVLHHLPDPAAGLAACVRKLKPGAPLLVYLYYAFDHRPAWFRALWRASDWLRRGISRLPGAAKLAVSEVLAALVYWPLARGAALAERAGKSVEDWPLAAYRDKRFYVMRTDALDRFGTRLEHRYTRAELAGMLHEAGLERVAFRDGVPYWCALGYRRAD